VSEAFDHRYLTVAEAIERYKVSQASLYRLMAEGRLTRHKRTADRRVYLLMDQLDQLFKPRPEP
jgi:predicted DNA-binding transcriptional regulator AlpA